MKFKPLKCDPSLWGIEIKDSDGDALEVQTRSDNKKGLFFYTRGPGVMLTKSKALKLAHAIIAELDPENMWVMS